MTINIRPAEPERPGRYRPGSRVKRRNLVAVGSRRADIDLKEWGRIVIRAAAEQAARESERESHGSQGGDRA